MRGPSKDALVPDADWDSDLADSGRVDDGCETSTSSAEGSIGEKGERECSTEFLLSRREDMRELAVQKLDTPELVYDDLHVEVSTAGR